MGRRKKRRSTSPITAPHSRKRSWPSVTHSVSNGSTTARTMVRNVSVCWGMCRGTILHVTYAERGECIRITSARRAEKHERDYYSRENSIGRQYCRGAEGWE